MRLTKSQRGRNVLTVVFGLLLGQGIAGAQKDEIQVGKSAPVASATPAAGHWAQQHPFDPKTYGKVSGISPATSPEPKIVLYTRTLDKNFLRVAAAVDGFLAKHKDLEWSLVQVLEEKGAQGGGYTADEVNERIKGLQKIAAQNKITHLSFTISAPNAARFAPRLGLTGKNDLLVLRLGAGKEKHSHSVIEWMARYDTSALSDAAVREIVAELEKSSRQKNTQE